MKLIPKFCCNALINPFNPMVEAYRMEYPFSRRLLILLAGLMAGSTIAQALGCLAGFFVIEDTQAAQMLAHLLIQQMSYYLLGSAFVILSLSNVLIKRGVLALKGIRLPSLILLLSIAVSSFLLIPRMDYLREAALQHGMPVMLSPFANYYSILNRLTSLLLAIEIILGIVIAWRMSKKHSS
jgi:hypothetical protein